MEEVIATVSGYHGSERFNLIRLISHSGASYVGNMNRSVTHLVCWRFEGRKYELAKKFKIPILNHGWVEECVKRGMRVPEEPYLFQSGEEMRPLALDILLGINTLKAQHKEINTLKAQPKELRNSKQPVNSAECEHDIFPQQRQDSPCSNRSSGKAIERYSRKDCPSSRRYFLENPSGLKILEVEEASTSQAAYSCGQNKRNSTSPELKSKGRRLVKKHTSIKDWLSTSNENQHKELKMDSRNGNSVVLLDISDVERHQSTSNEHASGTRCNPIGQDNTDACDAVRETLNLDNEDENSHVHSIPPSLETTEELQEAALMDSAPVDPVELLPASSDLSCVICWTDFSSTRGVLPCGHRFCFSCIQNWADHMTSRRKPSTCPLCKASFICITKVDDAVSSDQKIYSQSIPNDSSKINLYLLPDESNGHRVSQSAPVCCRCSGTEPEDLLIKCHFCQIRCIHTYCLDPPSFPWACVHCNDLQRLYLHSR